MSLLPQGKQYLFSIQGFKEKLEFWKTCIHHCNCELDDFPILEDFSDEIGGECSILYNELCQHLEDLKTE